MNHINALKPHIAWVQDSTLLIKRPNFLNLMHLCVYYFLLLLFFTVSTTEVLFCFLAFFTVINFPVIALLPLFLLPDFFFAIIFTFSKEFISTTTLTIQLLSWAFFEMPNWYLKDVVTICDLKFISLYPR